MFGLFKTKNAKKKEKRESLSVKSRASETRAHRVRVVGTLFCFSVSLFLLVMLGWKGIEYLMREAVYKNPSLAIERIDVETDGVLSSEKILEWSGVKIGDNLLALDLTRLKRDLELRPIVEFASAEKILPRHLRINVVERKPVAVVYLYRSPQAGSGAAFDRVFLDSHGMVIPPLRHNERSVAADPNPSALPVMTGFNPRELRPGLRVDAPQLRAALDLLTEYERSPVATMIDFRSIDLSSRDTLVVKTDQESSITFSLENFPRQLARLETTLNYARRQQRVIASLDLAVGNYVPLRWFELSTNAPAATPFIAPTLKPRKKHV